MRCSVGCYELQDAFAARDAELLVGRRFSDFWRLCGAHRVSNSGWVVWDDPCRMEVWFDSSAWTGRSGG